MRSKSCSTSANSDDLLAEAPPARVAARGARARGAALERARPGRRAALRRRRSRAARRASRRAAPRARSGATLVARRGARHRSAPAASGARRVQRAVPASLAGSITSRTSPAATCWPPRTRTSRHDAAHRRREADLHLHRLEQAERLPRDDAVAGRHVDRGDHRRRHRAHLADGLPAEAVRVALDLDAHAELGLVVQDAQRAAAERRAAPRARRPRAGSRRRRGRRAGRGSASRRARTPRSR